MRVVALVQARMGSTRLPGKVLKPILRKPMLWHVVDRLSRARTIDEIVIATTDRAADEPIREFCRKNKLRVFAGSEDDVLDRFYRAAKSAQADAVLRITADCPFADPQVVDKLVRFFKKSGCDLASVATGAGAYHFKGNKYPDGLDAECMKMSALERAWNEATEKRDREHVTPYLWRNTSLFDFRWLESDKDFSQWRWTVDNAPDLRMVGQVYSALYKKKVNFGLREIHKFLTEHPDVAKMNRQFVGKEGYAAIAGNAAPRVLIVGRGSIGRKHERNALDLGSEVLTVDPSPAASASFRSLKAALSKGRFYTHAVVASPAKAHLSDWKLLAKAGIPNILIEKPLGLQSQLAIAKRLSKSVKAPRRVYMGFNWRLNRAVREIAEACRNGKLGRVEVVQMSARESLSKYKGNVLLESGSHILDTARFILGEIRPVAACLTSFRKWGSADEAASIFARTKIGADVYLHVNFANAGEYDYRILVQGSKGTIERRPDRTEPMHREEMRAFLFGKGEGLAGLNDGLRNLEILNEIKKISKNAVCR